MYAKTTSEFWPLSETVLLWETARGIPPRQTCSSITYPGEGVPYPDLAGGGWWGYSSPGQWGGYPILARGVPHPVLVGGVPHQDLLGGTHYRVPPPTWDWGTPSPRKGPGTRDWGTPRKDMCPVEVLWDRDGVPTPREDMGPVEVLWDGDGVHPPIPGGGQSENITSRQGQVGKWFWHGTWVPISVKRA